MYYMDLQLSDIGLSNISFSCTKDGCISDVIDENGEAIKLDMDGNAGIGTVNIDVEGNISFKLEKNGYCTYKYAINNDINIIKGKCDNIGAVDDMVAPVKSYVDSINKKDNLEDNQKYFVKENSTYKSQLDIDTNIYLNDIVDISEIKATDGYVLINDGKVAYGIFQFDGKEYECDSNKCEIRDKGNYIISNNIIRYNYDDEANTDAILKNLAGDSIYDGEIHNATYTDDGLSFNGTDSYVAIGEFNPEHLTVEVTFKFNNLTNDIQDIIANLETGGFGCMVTASNHLNGQIFIDDGYKNITSRIIPNVDQIYNLTLSYDESTMKFYINGILQGTYVSSLGIGKPSNNTWLVLGGNPAGSYTEWSLFNGSIYSVRTYDRALTDYEVNHNYMMDKNKYLVD